jgi:RNase P/RNase MRP subunit POP5
VGVISYPTNFFGNVASQHVAPVVIDDKLERAILNVQRKDAAIVKRAIRAIVTWITASEARPDDKMANAILACQRRDAAIVWHALSN